MAIVYQLTANKMTLFSDSYDDLADAQAAASPLIATDYTINYSYNGTKYFLNASLVENFTAQYPTEEDANTASESYLTGGYQVAIYETEEPTPIIT